MIKHYCDKCGKEMDIWLSVKVKVTTSEIYDWINVENLLEYTGEKQICGDCWKKWLEQEA